MQSALNTLETFFSYWFGADFDMTIVYSICVCLLFLMVYGFFIRPLLNFTNGKKNRWFFDSVVAVLILMIGFKLLFPSLFVKDGFTEEDLQDYYDQGYSDGYDRGEGEGYDKGYADGLKEGANTPDVPEFPVYESLEAFGDEHFPYHEDKDMRGYVTHVNLPYLHNGFSVYVSNRDAYCYDEIADQYRMSDYCDSVTPAFVVDDVIYYYYENVNVPIDSEFFSLAADDDKFIVDFSFVVPV